MARSLFQSKRSIVQLGKPNFAGRDWPANLGTKRGRKAGIWLADWDARANLPESRGFLPPGKPGWFALTGWWWTQSCRTGLPCGRICRGVELDPLYVDVIVRRYEAASGEAAVLVETGETFEDLEQRRARERPSATLMETDN